MHTVFLLERQKNSGLFPQVLQAFAQGKPNHGVIMFRDLYWRKMPNGELAAEVYDTPVTQLPDALILATYKLELFDLRDDLELASGHYRLKSASAEVVLQSPALPYLYDIGVSAKRLDDLNELHRRILTGAIKPNRN